MSDSSSITRPPALPPTSEPNAWKRGFWGLFTIQFQGALSDNIFKFLVLFTINDLVNSAAERDLYVAAIAAIFSLPFLLFSMTAGYLADRYPKRKVVIGTKWMEVGLMIIGTAGLVMGSVPILLLVIFLMSTQSTFFSPAKYGTLPEILPVSRLAWGNGMLSLGTFMAIISGGIVAGLLYKLIVPGQPLAWGLLLIGLAGLGLVATKALARIGSANPKKQYTLNPLVDLRLNLAKARKDRVLMLALIGASYFWFLGALLGDPALFVYNEELLGLEEDDYGMLRAFLAIGIGIGSAVAGFVAGRKVDGKLVPIGALGMAVFACLMALPGVTVFVVGALLFFLGFSGGFYIVPLNTLVQHRPAAEDKGSAVATNGWLTSLGVFLAAGVFWMLKSVIGLSPAQIFLAGGIMTLGVAVVSMRLVPRGTDSHPPATGNRKRAGIERSEISG